MLFRLVEMRKIRGKLVMLSGIFLGIAAAAFLYDNYRNGVMARLYAEAAGYPQYYRGAVESQAAVKILATYRGRRSTSLLLNIALRQNPLAPEAQTEAIKELSKRKDPDIAMTLANMLQPHEGLGTRQAVAEALQNIPCNRECIDSILHYLERVWWGEPNEEDRTVFPPGTENLKSGQLTSQQVLYASLYSVLQREKIETLTNLVQVYGLGSNDPSPFALALLSRTQLHEACPYLMRSDQSIKNSPSGLYTAPPKELQAAIASLNCK
jgi:hypothetical protein